MATDQPREWSHDEQQRLQAALRRFPATTEKVARWQGISEAVGRPGKECIAQCRLLAAAVGAKKVESKAADDPRTEHKAADEGAAAKRAAVDAAAKLEAERRQTEAVSKQDTAAQAKREAEAIATQGAKAAAKAEKEAAAKVAKKAASKEKKASTAPAAAPELGATAPVQGVAPGAADEAGGKGKGAKGKGQAAVGKGKGRGGKGAPAAEQQAAAGATAEMQPAAGKGKGKGGKSKGGKGASSADAPQSAAAAEGQGAASKGKGKGGKGKGAEPQGGAAGGAAGGKGKEGKSGKGGHKWWTRELLTEVDPISLEPLRSLRYAPFELRADPGLSHATSSDWFDGAVLAAYLIQTGHFSHPISRRELGRAECEALDAYLQQHRLMQRLRRDAPELEDVARTKTKVATAED